MVNGRLLTDNGRAQAECGGLSFALVVPLANKIPDIENLANHVRSYNFLRYQSAVHENI